MKELLTKWAINHIKKCISKLPESRRSYAISALEHLISLLKNKEV